MKYKLGEVSEITKLAGFEFTKYITYNTTGEIIALRALNLRNGRLDLTDIKRIDRSVSDGLLRSKLYRDDILLTYTGNGYGDCAIIEENDKYHLAPNICKITPNNNLVNPYFLYCVIRNSEFRKLMSNYVTGSGQPTIPMKTLRVLELDFPCLEVQNKISLLLKNIDQKIQTNDSINKNLAEQAQTLFKSWFIDREQYNGDIPSSWRVGKLSDIASISTKSFSPEKNPGVQVEHYSIPAFDETKYPVFEVSDDIKSNKYILSSNSVMISKLNPDTKRVWRPYVITDNAVSSTEFIVFEALNPKYRDFVYSIIDSVPFSNHMCAHTSGSTNSRQRTMPKTTLEFEVVLPTDEEIVNFCSIVTPIYDLIQINILENQKLAALRDSLLPKLMSGEIDVSKIKI